MKHSGEFLYKISNEDDVDRFKLTKIRMPHEVKEPRVRLEASPISKNDSSKQEVQVQTSTAAFARLGKPNDLAPTSNYLTERNDYLLPISDGSSNPLTGLSD